MNVKAILLILLVSFGTGCGYCADFFQPLRVGTPPIIDGILNDRAWENAQELNGFKTFIPDFEKDLSEATSAYMAYDSQFLYFAFRCRDRNPKKIKATMAKRDELYTDDFICINLDTFNDQQSLYAFYANPLGIQGDSRFSNNVEDFSVDFVWSSAGRLDENGYTIEMRIPFKSIRYAGRERVEMAIFFERYISRTTEHGSYPAFRPEKGYAFLTQMMPLKLRDIKRYMLLEVLPDFVFSQKHERDEGMMRRSFSRGEVGVTGKLGITSKLTLDVAWNPDFSQVESDAGQVDANLRYDLFYAEKRPFFLEGSDIFLQSLSSPFQSAVHTRQIVDPRIGFKLSGKLGRQDTVGLIYALDETVADGLHSDAGVRDAVFTIFRYKHSLWQDGYIGAFYTAREQGQDHNRVAGFDGRFRLSSAGVFSFHGFASFTRNLEVQEAKGTAYAARYTHFNRNLEISGELYGISRDFFSESGYLTRNGVTGLNAGLSPKLYPKSTFFRKIQPSLFGSLIRDHFSGLNEGRVGTNAAFLFPGNAMLTLEAWLANEIFLAKRFDISGFRLIFQNQLNKQLSLYGAYRRESLIRYVSDPYPGYGNKLVGQVRYQPSDHFDLAVMLTFADFFRRSDGSREFDYTILRNKITYQMNRFLFFRLVVEYNSYWEKILTDFLASFTYIPGTVIQFGYGAQYNRQNGEGELDRDPDRYQEMKRGFFFKASYLWRL